jgi:hypothetical protein
MKKILAPFRADSPFLVSAAAINLSPIFLLKFLRDEILESLNNFGIFFPFNRRGRGLLAL